VQTEEKAGAGKTEERETERKGKHGREGRLFFYKLWLKDVI